MTGESGGHPRDTLRSERLVLRRWRDSDRAPFAAMGQDPEVMRFFPAPLTREQSDAFVDRIDQHHDTHGFSLWAIEVPGVAPFIGFTGLMVPAFEAHFTPAVEVGWRIARQHWGRGYATEAARAAVASAFTDHGLHEVVSFTVPGNERSIAVMERIGMRRDPAGDFDHPNLPEASPLRRHVLYRIRPGELT